MSVAESIFTPRHEVLASGYRFVEAPRVDECDAVYFSDLAAIVTTGGGPAATPPQGAVVRIRSTVPGLRAARASI